MPPAARILDFVAHPAPPTLVPGPGSPNVLIGFLPAWRGLPRGFTAALEAAHGAARDAITQAEALSQAARTHGADSPEVKKELKAAKGALQSLGGAASQLADTGAPSEDQPVPAAVAQAFEQAAKASVVATMSSVLAGLATTSGADIHQCVTPLPSPPHGPGMVIDGSSTVVINGLPACYVSNTVMEAAGPVNKITMGCPTVLIGDAVWTDMGAQIAALRRAKATAAPFCLH